MYKKKIVKICKEILGRRSIVETAAHFPQINKLIDLYQ